MKRISRKAKITAAVILNIILFTALSVIITKYADSLQLTILFASLTHISLNGSLLYFIYVSPADIKNPVDDTSDTMSYFAVPVTK